METYDVPAEPTPTPTSATDAIGRVWSRGEGGLYRHNRENPCNWRTLVFRHGPITPGATVS